jgi:hypothetical protein
MTLAPKNKKKFQEKNLLKEQDKLQVLYVKDDDPFPEVSDFIEMSRNIYNLDIVEVSRPMKEGLQVSIL